MAADRSLLEVRQAAPWAVLEAGCALIGNVEVLDDDGHAINAWVHGEGDHVVRMARVTYGDVACTCGGGRAPWCAHAVAVALTMLHDGCLESGEALARFAARADAMARLVEAEEALAVQYAATVGDDATAFADLLVDLRGRDLDRQITGTLSGPSADDARRVLRHLEQSAAERVDEAELRFRGLAGLEKLTVVVEYGDLDPSVRGPAATVHYSRARAHVGGAWTSPGWRVLESLARMLEVGCVAATSIPSRWRG